MKRGSILFFAALLLLNAPCVAQGQFRYKRSIRDVSAEGWHTLSLPSSVFRRLSPDFGDVRLFSVTGADTLELPYILAVRQDEIIRQKVDLPLFNRSVREGVLYLMFELRPSQKVNYIDLGFEEEDYFGFVTIEGSDDRRAWFELVRDKRIVSVSNGQGEYTLPTVAFPTTDYRYLRVAVRSDVALTFRRASFELTTVDSGVYRSLPLAWSTHTDKKSRRTFVDIRLADYVPVSSIVVEADSAADYYRPFQIEYLRDSSETEKGWVRYYQPLYEGYLTSFSPNEFSFGWQTARELRLVIRDHDNAPLAIRNIRAAGPEVQLISYLKPANNFMLYGADAVRSPHYDLAYFESKISGTDAVAVFGAEEIIAAEKEKVSALFESRLWLWSVMILIIGGLGFFTLRMMKREG